MIESRIGDELEITFICVSGRRFDCNCDMVIEAK